MVTKAKMLGSIPGKTVQIFSFEVAATIAFNLKSFKRSVNVKNLF